MIAHHEQLLNSIYSYEKDYCSLDDIGHISSSSAAFADEMNRLFYNFIKERISLQSDDSHHLVALLDKIEDCTYLKHKDDYHTIECSQGQCTYVRQGRDALLDDCIDMDNLLGFGGYDGESDYPLGGKHSDWKLYVEDESLDENVLSSYLIDLLIERLFAHDSFHNNILKKVLKNSCCRGREDDDIPF